MEDSILWLDLLSRYEFTGQTEAFLHLRKRHVPLAVSRRVLATHTATIGQIVDVPKPTDNDSVVWMRIAHKRSLAGKLLSQLYKPPGLWLKVRTEDRIYGFRFLTSNEEEGFIVSPLIVDMPSLKATFARQSPNNDFVPIQLIVSSMPNESAAWYFGESMTIEFSEVRTSSCLAVPVEAVSNRASDGRVC